MCIIGLYIQRDTGELMKYPKLEDVATQSMAAVDVPTQSMAVVDSAGERNRRLQVARYAEWLTMQTRRNTLVNTLREMNDYAEGAGKTVLVGERKVNIFAPFRPEHSALWVMTRWQSIALVVLVLGWCLGLQFFRQQTLIVTMTAITALYLGHLLMTVGMSFLAFRRVSEEEIDDEVVTALRDADWPYYTILCPLYREARVVPQFVRAMQALDYPTEKLQILFLTEVDDAETRNAIRALALPSHFKIITVPDGSPRTKPRACNFGLMQAVGQYVVIFDAEDIPEPTQLKKAVLTFANHGPNLACVQAKLNFYNPYQNLLTRWFTAEYSLWFDLILPGLQRAKLSIPLGGTSNHFPTQILRALGGWDAFNVTEDCDLGLRLSHYQMETVVLNSTTYEEANSKFKNWIRQRSRWIKGYMQTYLINMRRPWRYLRPGRFREFVSLQLVIGGKTAFLFINPFLWCLFALYLFLSQYVGSAYHQLFPKPLLYAGTFTLVFGNFFYIYMYLLACLRRRQYQLIKWAFTIPLYWVMMSIAACMALYQLIVKPHYWEKTEHGLHLDKKAGTAMPDFVSINTAFYLEDTPTMHVPTPSLAYAQKEETASSITAAFQAILTLPLPAFTRQERVELKQPERKGIKDPWLLMTFITACVASIGACWYYFQQHEILLYGDAYSHLRIARRVLDNTTPGFAQLGGVWLPLPHLLMLPFIWNDYLWRSGLAGSFSSMLCYVVAAVYLFLSARRLTQDNRASFVGTLLFICNPNVLYLQSTPLSELISVATTVMACYYFLAWIQDEHPKYLVGMAASTFLATLSRYDGWGLFLILFVLLVVIGWIKRQRWSQIQGTLLIFGSLGSLGIVLWILWDAIILGDPLYWHNYLLSSGANTQLYTYHNLWQSTSAYMILCIKTVGPLLFVLAAIAVVGFVFWHRLAPTMFAGVAFLAPFAFYILILFAGQDAVYLPGVGPGNTGNILWNDRFGVQTVAPVALFLAILAKRWFVTNLAPLWTAILQVALVIVIGIQTLLTVNGGIISLQDGLYGASCIPTERITIYLAQHYAGGKILEDVNAFPINEADIGIDLKDTIYEGSGALWQRALQDPAAEVDWIIAQPALHDDLIASNIDLKSPQFLSQFTFVLREGDGLTLYHRNGLPPLPTRAIETYLVSEHSLCRTGITGTG
jgi:cellulose synthase/poly-beta-1,6-N-acetylglucosamine synthase-like glycosyltransferase